jgi:RecG-like helicase
MTGDKDRGLLRRAVRRLTAETRELDDEQLQRQAEDLGAAPMATCQERTPVTVFGTVRSLTIRPRAGTPALEAELYDGSGVITLVFLGRRTIAGIGPGRQLRASGRIATHDGRRLMFNPRYELLTSD